MERISGIISAVATPFSSDGEAVDEGALRALIDQTVTDGADALVACASTGEFATLTPAERRAVVLITIDQASGRVPVIVNTGALSTAQAIELSREAEREGAAAVMPVAPYYDPLLLHETFAYHSAIAAAVDLPVIVYNHPDTTGVELPVDFIARLAREIPNVQYVKDSSPSMLHVTALVSRYGDEISVLSGMDAFLLPILELGAAGGVLGTANFLAAPYARLLRTFRDGDHSAARELWTQLMPVLLLILDGERFSFQAGVKAASRLTGLDIGDPRLPLAPADHEYETELAAALAQVPDLSARLGAAVGG